MLDYDGAGDRSDHGGKHGKLTARRLFMTGILKKLMTSAWSVEID